MVKTKKFSYKRNVIFDILKLTKLHPSAEWVYNMAKLQIPDISMGTVYRNLSQFKDDGKIISLGVINGQERFDADTMPHDHFVCNNCGKIIDIDYRDNSSDDFKALSEKYDVKISSVSVIYYGFCKNCISAK